MIKYGSHTLINPKDLSDYFEELLPDPDPLEHAQTWLDRESKPEDGQPTMTDNSQDETGGLIVHGHKLIRPQVIHDFFADLLPEEEE